MQTRLTVVLLALAPLATPSVEAEEAPPTVTACDRLAAGPADRDKIAEGRTMAEPLAEANVFPSMVVQMIGVGEATGAMDVMLNKIADFYEEEVDVAVEALTALLEPMMMVFIGGIVGGLLIAMYLPIFTVADNVGAQ